MKTQTSSGEQVGVVESVEDHGSIVLVQMRTDKGKAVFIYGSPPEKLGRNDR